MSKFVMIGGVILNRDKVEWVEDCFDSDGGYGKSVTAVMSSGEKIVLKAKADTVLRFLNKPDVDKKESDDLRESRMFSHRKQKEKLFVAQTEECELGIQMRKARIREDLKKRMSVE